MIALYPVLIAHGVSPSIYDSPTVSHGTEDMKSLSRDGSAPALPVDFANPLTSEAKGEYVFAFTIVSVGVRVVVIFGRDVTNPRISTAFIVPEVIVHVPSVRPEFPVEE